MNKAEQFKQKTNEAWEVGDLAKSYQDILNQMNQVAESGQYRCMIWKKSMDSNFVMILRDKLEQDGFTVEEGEGHLLVEWRNGKL